MSRQHHASIVACTLLLGWAAPALAEEPGLPPPATGPVDFARDVRPILARKCWGCHGPKRMEGGLRLHVAETARDGGDSGPAFLAGNSGESRLIRYVAGLDEDHLMPPDGVSDPLTPEQVGVLRAWIDAGAEYPADLAASDGVRSDHWAFRAPTRPEPPAVSDPAWPRNPIDRFVLARLDREGLRPSPEADRATLIRRVSLDLIGLPPTPEEVDAFVDDPSPDAYETVVDRLLASPHYGERWARRWLDRARYADTNGYEKDRDRSIWPYRDWVIRALNADMPFDRFTVEQIAGDLLPDATADQRIATGFHRNTMINEEGGIDVEEFRFASVVDRVATTGAVWLGLTIGCAQCHTHKFDPITQREYYRFFALLNNADEPEMAVPDPAVAARRDEVAAQIAALEAGLVDQFPDRDETQPDLDADLPTDERRRRHLDRKQAAWEAAIPAAPWTVLTPSKVTSRKHATMTVLADGSVLVTGDKPNNDVYEVELPLPDGLAGVTALRLEALPDPSLPDGGPGRAPLFSVGDFLLTEFQAALAAAGDDPAAPKRLGLAGATESYAESGRSAALAIDGVTDTGWAVKGGIGRPHAAVFPLAEPLSGDLRGARLVVTLHQEYIHQMTLGRFRLSATAAPGPVRASGVPAEVEEVLLVPPPARTAAQADRVRAHYLSVAPELAKAREPIEPLRKSMPAFATTMVMRERAPEHARTTRIHRRGEFTSPTTPVEPGVPAVLHPLPAGARADRLALARWLVAPENPLVGRVAMNQAWQAFFGQGLVATIEDFGTRGDRPTHPELLDWLAATFVEDGWSQKRMHRRIVTSATYRQSSRVSPELLARDPRNTLLARGPRFRVEAELVRDLALAASGLLNPAIGGPSVYPPQPEGVTSLAYGQVPWKTSTGPDRYRRGLYTFVKRTAPYAAFATMDAPSPEVVCVRRERSNTPLQALTLLNDGVFVEAAQALARRVLAEAPPPATDADRARLLFRLCLARRPDPEELALLLDFHRAQLARIEAGEVDAARLAGGDPKAPDLPERAAWTALARAVLNLDETTTRE